MRTSRTHRTCCAHAGLGDVATQAANTAVSAHPVPAEWDAELAAILDAPDTAFADSVTEHIDTLLAIAESAVAQWLRAHGGSPTTGQVEGFRLLALHRQGARLDPTFNACRESCRELIYQCNMARAHPAQAVRRLRLASMVCRHLVLFVFGKLETAALGEFCCASRPLRTGGAT